MRGRRRFDRIMDDDYLAGLSERLTDELRAMRDECEEEESGISFARRIIQGKLDILRAEVLRRRDEGEDGAHDLLDALPTILADEPSTRLSATRATRFLVPPSVEYHRREVERLVDDHALAALPSRSVDEIVELVERLATRERELSTQRRNLLDRIDTVQAELAKRYQRGQADVADVLPRG